MNKKLGGFSRLTAVSGPAVPKGDDVQPKGASAAVAQPGCPGRALAGSGGTGALLCDCRTHSFQSLCLPVFSHLFVCPRSWADSILRRNMYCLLSSMNRQKPRPVDNEEGQRWWRFRSSSILRQQSKVVGGGENSSKLKTQRRKALGKSARAPVAEAARSQVWALLSSVEAKVLGKGLQQQLRRRLRSRVGGMSLHPTVTLRGGIWVFSRCCVAAPYIVPWPRQKGCGEARLRMTAAGCRHRRGPVPLLRSSGKALSALLLGIPKE